VLFRVAAGPRVGFGHLVRATSLAQALGVRALLSIRGSHPSAVRAARRLGAVVVRGTAPGRVLGRTMPDLFVVDDRVAHATGSWRRAARRLQVPIVSIHDLGLGLGDADLVVDGSIGATASECAARHLTGPRHAILNPVVLRPSAGGPRQPARDVVVALGGGPRRSLARRLALAVCRRRPGTRIAIAGGFVGARTPPTAEAGPGVTWIDSRDLGGALGAASVAVVGGGVTLYECLALGVASVAVSVAASQRPTVQALAVRGAIVDGGPLGASRPQMRRLAVLVGDLLDAGASRARLARTGRRLVDGRGAERVARAMRSLARPPGGGRGAGAR
jgi:spore coat polysaccharide biosynthesis predicted glycosyltransferase SpsG